MRSPLGRVAQRSARRSPTSAMAEAERLALLHGQVHPAALRRVAQGPRLKDGHRLGSRTSRTPPPTLNGLSKDGARARETERLAGQGSAVLVRRSRGGSLRAEAAALSGLRGRPGLARLAGWASEGGWDGLVLRGRLVVSLEELLERLPAGLPEAMVMRLGSQALLALAQIHARGLVAGVLCGSDFVLDDRGRLLLASLPHLRPWDAHSRGTSRSRPSLRLTRGLLDTAPLAAHQRRRLSPASDVQSLFFLLLRMAGQLPWARLRSQRSVYLAKAALLLSTEPELLVPASPALLALCAEATGAAERRPGRLPSYARLFHLLGFTAFPVSALKRPRRSERRKVADQKSRLALAAPPPKDLPPAVAVAKSAPKKAAPEPSPSAPKVGLKAGPAPQFTATPQRPPSLLPLPRPCVPERSMCPPPLVRPIPLRLIIPVITPDMLPTHQPPSRAAVRRLPDTSRPPPIHLARPPPPPKTEKESGYPDQSVPLKEQPSPLPVPGDAQGLGLDATPASSQSAESMTLTSQTSVSPKTKSPKGGESAASQPSSERLAAPSVSSDAPSRPASGPFRRGLGGHIRSGGRAGSGQSAGPWTKHPAVPTVQGSDSGVADLACGAGGAAEEGPPSTSLVFHNRLLAPGAEELLNKSLEAVAEQLALVKLAGARQGDEEARVAVAEDPRPSAQVPEDSGAAERPTDAGEGSKSPSPSPSPSSAEQTTRLGPDRSEELAPPSDPAPAEPPPGCLEPFPTPAPIPEIPSPLVAPPAAVATLPWCPQPCELCDLTLPS